MLCWPSRSPRSASTRLPDLGNMFDAAIQEARPRKHRPKQLQQKGIYTTLGDTTSGGRSRSRAPGPSGGIGVSRFSTRRSGDCGRYTGDTNSRSCRDFSARPAAARMGPFSGSNIRRRLSSVVSENLGGCGPRDSVFARTGLSDNTGLVAREGKLRPRVAPEIRQTTVHLVLARVTGMTIPDVMQTIRPRSAPVMSR